MRPGVPADLDRLAAIDEQAGVGSPRRIRIDRFLSGTSGWCLVAEVRDVAEVGRTVVGYVAVVPEHFFGRAFVELLLVARPYRRTGVGSALLHAALAEAARAADAEPEAVFTSTNASNAPMLALLRRDGWLLSGTLDGLDEDDPEVVFYRRAAVRGLRP